MEDINIFASIPSFKDYVNYIYPLQLSSDVSIIIIFKQLYRSDDVVIDIYLNEISDATKILGGRKLTASSILCNPRYDIGFEYTIYCVDMDGISQPINKFNTSKFYLQFVKEGK